LDSDGDATAADWTPGTCSFRMYQMFVYPKYDGGDVTMHFNGIKDGKGKDIGGEWGNKDPGDLVKDKQEIEIKSKLPQPLKIKVSPFDGKPKDIPNWKNSMHFTFSYGPSSEWPEYQEEPSDEELFQQSCATQYDSIIEKGYKLTYDCKFSC